MPATTTTRRTQAFYDASWLANVPDYRKTAAHVRVIVPSGRYHLALDGRSGADECAVALGELADVIGVDLNHACTRTGASLSWRVGAQNANFSQGSLLELPFSSSAGASSITRPLRSVRWTSSCACSAREGRWRSRCASRRASPLFTRLSGTSIWVSQPGRDGLLKIIYVRLPAQCAWRNSLAVPTMFATTILQSNRGWRTGTSFPRSISSRSRRCGRLFAARGLTYEVVCEQTGRFRSSSNFIVREQLEAGGWRSPKCLNAATLAAGKRR